MGNGKNSAAVSGAMSGASAGTMIGGPGIGTAIGAGIGGLAGFMGGQDDESGRLQQEMMDRVNAIQIPGLDQMQFTPEELQFMGGFSPEQLQDYVLQKSEMENLTVDPRLRQEQMKALDQVSQLADKGFSDEDMMAFNLARNNAAGEEQAKQGQILQNMQARGQGGSGNELIARLTSNQNSSNQLSNEQQKQAIAQAEARKQALTMLANQSGSLRSQDFGEGKDVANAKDLVNRINTANSQDVARANVAAKNNAGMMDQQTRQSISDRNTGIRNTGKQNNINAIKDQFDMNMAKATGQNNITQRMADRSQTGAQNSAAGIGQIGQGIVQMTGKGAFNSNPSAPSTPIPNKLNDPNAWEKNDVTSQIVNDPLRNRS